MDKEKQQVTDHDEEPYEEVEKMKSSPLKKSCEVYADHQPMGDDKVTAQKPGPLTRKCNLCGKTFSNGKALGGHRRSHFQAAKRNSQKVKTRFSNLSKTSNNKAICDYDYDDGKHTCYLCKKDFPSKNALFGHMRSHPERDWRGVCPPIDHYDKHTSSCSLTFDSMEQFKEDDDDDCVGKDVAPNEPPTIDLSKSSLPRWQKTDRRGRRSLGAYEAAENLVYIRWKYFCPESMVHLKEAAIKPKSLEAPIPCKEKISVNMDIGKEKEEREDDDWAKEKYYVKNVYETSEMCMKSEVMQDDVGLFYERKEIMLKKKNKGKKMKNLLLKPKTQDSQILEDKGFLDKTQKKLNDYACDICCKSFPTFQALGGHKSIHNKEKNIITMAKPKPSDDIVEDNNCKDSDVRELVMEEAANNIGTETLVGTPLNSEEPSTSQFVGPKILDFDLNKQPDDMHD